VLRVFDISEISSGAVSCQSREEVLRATRQAIASSRFTTLTLKRNLSSQLTPTRLRPNLAIIWSLPRSAARAEHLQAMAPPRKCQT
jgi:hypothetical protein